MDDPPARPRIEEKAPRAKTFWTARLYPPRRRPTGRLYIGGNGGAMVISLGQGYEFAVPNCREEMWVKVCPSAPTRVSAYAAALGIHYTVGYMSLVHLLPAFAGLGILLLGLGLSYSYLCGSPREQVAARAVTLPSS